LAYLVLTGYNDTPEHVDAIAKIIQSRPENFRHLFHINLLRYNPAFGIGESFIKTSNNQIHKFMKMLKDKGVPHVTARQSFGVDIDAACGQLYANYEKHMRGKAKPVPSSQSSQQNPYNKLD
jgi:23S rRNA (adenine-C8)-methyltransferase